jgi:hypothetical protein
MAKSLLDELREHLEGVENAWLFISLVIFGLAILAVLTLTGVYFYTRR